MRERGTNPRRAGDALDVAIVGGGVVGAALALALHRAGLRIALVERGAPPAWNAATYDPRVYALAPGSVRFLQALGTWDPVARARVSPYRRMQVWDRDPAESLCFDAAECGVAELGFIVEESLLRSTLWAALPATAIRSGQAVSGFGLRADRPWLRLDSGEVLECGLVVAAEGMESKLRDAAGIDTTGWSYPQRAVVCAVTTEEPHQATAWQRFLPGGPLAFLPLADGSCSIVWTLPAAEATRLLALPDEDFRRELADALGHRLGAVTTCGPRQAFPLRLLHAERYAAPGLALAGDSAHVIHPLAGQGVNLGLADARELAAALQEGREQGRVPGHLRTLKRYERARRAENTEMLALTDALQRAFALRAPLWNGLLNVGLRAVDRWPPVKRRLTARAMGL